ncbi:hypothetical protein [Aerococcus kribbianus]|uniref:Uncharacterized protein n=1 Tax=Aerococcus kribbianus TaxID=2999064 RepID=A0A9X3FLJ9_9LACT|nr:MULTISPECIES: hypothetical protein [unclassified Aerococcus]MCZ0716742.1 hypothetical protein [Aerococcus sp. YH-aer221]MCZ0725030.1 hypothetical protein [Aerococcus sp. YH-aer222]
MLKGTSIIQQYFLKQKRINIIIFAKHQSIRLPGYEKKKRVTSLDKLQCELLSLKHNPSYIRIHKQSTVNSRDIHSDYISDLKNTLPGLYDDIKRIHTLFSEGLF